MKQILFLFGNNHLPVCTLKYISLDSSLVSFTLFFAVDVQSLPIFVHAALKQMYLEYQDIIKLINPPTLFNKSNHQVILYYWNIFFGILLNFLESF